MKLTYYKCRLNIVLGNIFAQRLILSLRKVDDPGTRAVVSTLAFQITRESETESMDRDPFDEGPHNHGRGESSPVVVGGNIMDEEKQES